MKKLGLAFALLLTAGLCMAQNADFAKLAQNVRTAYQSLHGNLTDRQVQQKIKKNEILPVYVNEVASFYHTNSKPILVKNAQEQIRKHRNYVAYFNATVVCATNADWEGLDVDYQITDTDLANVLNYSQRAIELGGKTASPALYLLRAEAQMTHFGLFQPMAMNTVYFGDGLGKWISTHKKEVRKILADFEKLEKLNPSMAYIHAADIAEMYKYTGNAKEAARFENIARKIQAQEEQLQRQQAARVQQNVKRKTGAKAGWFFKK